MSILRVILGDQLSLDISSLKTCDAANDTILMCEVWDEATYVKHHKKKIAFIFSAMRHFALLLRAQKFTVEYIKLDDDKNTGSFTGEVRRALARKQYTRIVVTHPGEYRVLCDIQQWQALFGVPVQIEEDNRFLSTMDDFSAWAQQRKQLRMEYFYREMRKKHQILMDGEEPVGGAWNYDAQNRNPAKSGLNTPKPYTQAPDKITQDVMELVGRRFASHFGDLEPFYFAVTREQALEALTLFIDERLPTFGDFQDAMLEGEAWMYHAHISFYLNCGLLMPEECIRAAEKAYDEGTSPLNAVEGFIRQILGWREYVRGVYWLNMPEYKQSNYFHAERKLPEFYWTGQTQMNCIKQCVNETKQHAYAHHIQRLMVLGNFALLAGIHPDEVNTWFLVVYADAYEWVELPNVTGMALFADGGLLASKPYASGGNYIHKMSDYCKNCAYKVSKKQGEDACPFNYLYWDFLVRHRDSLQSNHRLGMIYKTYDKMTEEKKKAIEQDSMQFLSKINSN